MRKRHRALNRSALLVALAALCWGLSGGIAGLLVANGWDALLVAFFRGAIGLLCVLAWLALHPRASGLADRRLWFWAGIAGLGVTGNFAFYFLAITHAGVALAATLMYCAPVYVFLVSFSLGLETPTPRKWGMLALVLLGIVLLTGVYGTGGGITALGAAAGLLSGLCYAVFIFGFRQAAAHGSAPAALAIAFTVLVALLAAFIDPGQALAALRAPDWPLFVLLGVLGAGLSFYLFVLGMRAARPTVAAMMAMVEPVTASLFGVAVLGEHLAALQLAGMALVLVTVTALSVQSEG